MPASWIQGYIKLTEFLGKLLGPDYEVVLHDLEDKDNSIIAIANGHISGRTIGAPLTSVALQAIADHSYETSDYRVNYTGIAGDHRLLRSSTFYIKDYNGNLVGLLCINFDDSRYRDLSDRILRLRHPDFFVDSNFSYNKEKAEMEGPPSVGESENFHSSVTDLTEDILSQALTQKGVAADRLTKQEKHALVEELNAKGFFLLKGAIKLVAAQLKCSQTTVYRYLNKATLAQEDNTPKNE
ncbi:PAS domain-containing protein [Telmatospirillum sp.]|uniref:helix-turn-helix transcriptional regulator n=1 Tax=Telmatospirillum sp. TaxID=2079197 RepID=UPI00284F684A|nr:PAS domain-containing protein [Telmatospirillum sp.]MDR3435617.1 PAS domain-containing protein [Telmatospirillum sp.]